MDSRDQDSTADPLVGSVLGRYLLVRRLGEGGMGAVFEATDQELGRRVAIKVLHERFARSADVQRRFQREGQAASRVRHQNVADVYDVGRGEKPYLVMEFLEGENLARHIEREGMLTPEQAATLLLPVIAAVAAAHDIGVVHRDLKPDNIFLETRRNSIVPKVLDFGISKIRDASDAGAMTETGAFLGSPHYMSPEQTHGAKHVDARSDQYSLGVVLYECVTGRRPVEADAMIVLIRKIGDAEFPMPREANPALPMEFQDIILRAMAKEPDQRFPSLRAFGRALLPYAREATRAHYGPELASDSEVAAVDDQKDSGTGVPVRSSSVVAFDTTLGRSVHQRDITARASRGGYRFLTVVVALGAAGAGIALWQWPWVGRDAAPGSTLAAAALEKPVESPAVPAPASATQESAPAPAKKMLTSVPSDAAVWLGDVHLGKTPLLVEVPANATVEVELRLAGHASVKKLLTSADPDEIRATFAARPAPAGNPRPAADRPKLAPR
jgi:serine/threonine-protein kinase